MYTQPSSKAAERADELRKGSSQRGKIKRSGGTRIACNRNDVKEFTVEVLSRMNIPIEYESCSVEQKSNLVQ